jgi:protease-4
LLDTLHKRGTEIWVSSGTYPLKGLYLASVADRVFLTPEGNVVVPGLLSEGIYLKGLLDKLGIEVEAERFSEYKSAVEPLTRTEMSLEDSLQRAVLLQDFWDVLLPPIAQRLGLPADSVASLLLGHVYFTADEALAAGLVDELRYDDEVDSLFRREKGRPVTLRPRPAPVHREAWRDVRPVVAVVVVDGVIAQGPSTPPSPWRLPLLGDRVAGSWTYQQLFRRLRKDRRVRAVVVRIHSPGGDAFASEEIWREIARTSRVKPVVISMAGVAASGGYYIAMGGHPVLADALTITGSIGILNLRLVMRGLYKKLGIRKDQVQIGEHADVFSDWRPLTGEEREAMRRVLRKGYETFLVRVAHGRGMDRQEVEPLARGRVWSGERALRLGLVDQRGGVMTAVEVAAKHAHLKRYRVQVYPVEGSRFPWLLGPMEGMGALRFPLGKTALQPVYLELLGWEEG